MNPFEMVVAIVGISAVASVVRAKYGYTRSGGRRGRAAREFYQQGFVADDGLTAENNALKDEMRGLKERIQVLERLATDDESDARRLDREIEKLRDRPSLTAKDAGRE